MKDSKMELAQQVVALIQPDSITGLGASSSMPHIVTALSEAITRGLRTQLLTSSFVTQELLRASGLDVTAVNNYSQINLYIDGCDQFDKELNAVKSGGGIHTQEKLLASMADLFVLIGDQSKYTDVFNPSFPLVLDVLPQAFRYVEHQVVQTFPEARISLRMSDRKIGPALTDNGHYLLDVWFKQWPESSGINTIMKKIAGVVETSFFYQLAQRALLAGDSGLTIIEKPTN